MNLYRIIFIHYSPKDSAEGTVTYLLASSPKEVFNFIDKEYKYGSWSEKPETGMDSQEIILNNRGEWGEEVYDLYYRAIQYGWELVKEDIHPNCAVIEDFIKLGIITRV